MYNIDKTKTNNMNIIRKIISVISISVFTIAVFAQNSVKLSGKIIDANGEIIVGANILERGTSNGIMSDSEGGFTLTVSSTDAVISVSCIGYSPQEISLDNRTYIEIVLTEDTQSLGEIIVVGYGTQKKINATGSVSSISSDKIVNRPIPSLTTAISGLAPGVSAIQKSGNPGNESVDIRIRGTGSFNSSSPLILVDGAVADMAPVNPDDVESITFLKDAASASIYGSRAANGVILITTKKGKREAPKIVFSALAAQERAITNISFLSDMPLWMNLHNTAQRNNSPTASNFWYRQETIDAWAEANANPNALYTDPTTGNTVPNWLAYPNTDWAREIFQPTYYQKYNLSVSGGSNTSTYFVSAGFQNNPGTLENTAMKRINIRTNLETKILNFITFGTQTYATKEYKDPGNVEMTFLYQAFPSIYPKYKGLYGYSEDPNMTPVNNILQSVAIQGGINEYTRINTTWYANADIWNGISVETKFNYSEYMQAEEHYTKNLPYYSFRQGTDKPVYGAEVLNQAQSYRNSYNSKNYTADILLKYAGSFGDHNINLLLGYEQFWSRTGGFNATKKGLIDWRLTDITSAAEMVSIGGSATSEYAMISWFGRVNYDYLGKYLLEINFRSDESSRFAPGHRRGIFPSFSAGWRMSEETFFDPLKSTVNSLKLRASYGSLGNTVSGNYDWQILYKKINTVLNEATTNGLIQSQLLNSTLSWEKVTNFDLGLEATFLNHRLRTELTWYRRQTTGILAKPPQYLTMGNLDAPMSNTADMLNRGLEIMLSWNDRINELNYGASINASYNINRITKFKGALKYEQDPATPDVWGNPTLRYTNLSDVSTGGDTRRVEGHAIDEYFLRRPYQGNGTYANPDGTVNPKGGPKDGMIRTKADLEWVKAMIAQGHTFNNNNKTVRTNAGSLWYGEMIMDDVNGDGRYGNDNDREFTGKSSSPKWVFGLNLFAEWKGLDLSMTWSGRLGSWNYINERGVNRSIIPVLNEALPSTAASLFYSYDALKAVADYENYDPANDPTANINGKYPRLLNAGSTMVSNIFYLYNTSYLKLKNLQIGYTLPHKWINPLRISNLRIFLSGENLLTFAHRNFPGVDPELGGAINVYPIARMFSGGLTITF
jgi:TonB-linked SusC/RagA family outer membrane protein